MAPLSSPVGEWSRPYTRLSRAPARRLDDVRADADRGQSPRRRSPEQHRVTSPRPPPSRCAPERPGARARVGYRAGRPGGVRCRWSSRVRCPRRVDVPGREPTLTSPRVEAAGRNSSVITRCSRPENSSPIRRPRMRTLAGVGGREVVALGSRRLRSSITWFTAGVHRRSTQRPSSGSSPPRHLAHDDRVPLPTSVGSTCSEAALARRGAT